MTRITLFADLILPLSVPNLYTYRVPLEWNELVKRARAEKEAREKPAPAPSSRSAEGTVEMLDMLKNAAKAKKDGAGVQ